MIRRVREGVQSASKTDGRGEILMCSKYIDSYMGRRRPRNSFNELSVCNESARKTAISNRDKTNPIQYLLHHISNFTLPFMRRRFQQISVNLVDHIPSHRIVGSGGAGVPG